MLTINPKISIITATFNSANTIGDMLRSLESQRFSDFEHIVIDGASRDETLAIVRSHARLNTLIVSEPDLGIYDALNKGIAKSHGDVVGFLHADDLFSNEDVLEKVAAAFEDPDVEVVYGDLVYVREGDVSRVVRYWKAGDFEMSALRRGWMPPHPAFYARRSLYERFGAFDMQYRISADYDLMVRFFVRGVVRVRYLPEVLIRMRVGGVSNRSLLNILQKSFEDLEIARRNDIGGLSTVVLKNLGKIGQFWGNPSLQKIAK